MNSCVLCIKKSLLLIILLFLLRFTVKADDWVLAAQQFDFTQNTGHSSVDKSITTLLPQLILEQLSSSSVRVTSEEEMLDRKLNELQTKKLSLYLQLTKEIKVRDALVLTEYNSYNLQESIKNEESIIKDLKKQIDENIKEAAESRAETVELLRGKETDYRKVNFFDLLKRFFINDERYVDNIESENIVLYESDSNLYVLPEELQNEKYDSYLYEEALLKENIHGLITGSITILDEYIAVTSELRIFPGNRVVSSVTEVGSISDCLDIAKNISYEMIPKITNSVPVSINLTIEPEEVVKDVSLMIDGVLYSSDIKNITVSSGIHTLEINADTYDSFSLVYDFSNFPFFDVYVPLKKSVYGNMTLFLKHNIPGSFYTNGVQIGSVDEFNEKVAVTINGKPIIGQFFIGEDTDSYSSFFYIPKELQVDGEALCLNIKPVDIGEEIEKRRVWMYRGYTALVLTLPFTFYSIGERNNLVSAYNRGTNVVLKSDAQKWINISYVAQGISITAGAFFVYELVRYLYTASNILPKKVEKNKKETAINNVYSETQPINVDNIDSGNIENKDGK